MAGQFPGQFGPVVPTAAKGPFGVGAKVLLCLVAVLTAGLLGFVPAVALAARRKRRVDVVGAVVFAALSLLMLVCAVIGERTSTRRWSTGSVRAPWHCWSSRRRRTSC